MSGAHVEGEKMRRGRQSERENLQYVCVWDKTGIGCVLCKEPDKEENRKIGLEKYDGAFETKQSAYGLKI